MSFRKSFHVTPAVTLRAKALRPFGDGYPLGTLVDDVQVPSSGDATAPLRLARTSSDDHNGAAAFRRCRTGKAFDV
jgi:hypothetical protein